MTTETSPAPARTNPNNRAGFLRRHRVATGIGTGALSLALAACNSGPPGNYYDHLNGKPQPTVQGAPYLLDCNPKDDGPRALAFTNSSGITKGGLPESWHVAVRLTFASGEGINVYLGGYTLEAASGLQTHYYGARRDPLTAKDYQHVLPPGQVGQTFVSTKGRREPHIGNQAEATAQVQNGIDIACDNGNVHQATEVQVPPPDPAKPQEIQG